MSSTIISGLMSFKKLLFCFENKINFTVSMRGEETSTSYGGPEVWKGSPNVLHIFLISR